MRVQVPVQIRVMVACVFSCIGALCWADSPPEMAALSSPNGRNVLRLYEVPAAVGGDMMAMMMGGGGGVLRYSITRDSKPIIAPSPLGLNLKPMPIMGAKVVNTTRRTVDQTYALVTGKASSAHDHFNELIVSLTEPSGAQRKLEVVFRAYDDGIAVRYRLPSQPGLQQVEISGESTQFRFADAQRCWGLNLGRTGTSHEGEYDAIDAGLIRAHHLYDSPLTCRTASGATFMIAEADLNGYGGLYLTGISDGTRGVAVEVSPLLDQNEAGPFGRVVARRQMTAEGIDTPWRVVLLADRPGDLIGSQLIGNLNPPTSLTDTSWIKPGKSAWDWWSGPYGMGPAGKMDMATLERFIDFAGDSGFEYMLIDAGWSYGSDLSGMGGGTADVTRSIAALDIPALVARAKARNVGVMVWLDWSQLDKQMDAALAQYEKWGLKGIKVDYMNRDDQQMVDFYHRLLRKAAEHKLLVDLHGAYHPTGLNRTWPNFITQEGVLGGEYNKWSARVTARHNVTLPYTRMVIGPLDYTPGGFHNVTPKAFTSAFKDPSVMTTRGHGLAMYVVYDSPLQMVSDSPEAYADAAGFEFIKQVPASWDETRFIAGDIGEYIVLARRKGKDWYLGAMTNEGQRTVEVPLDFLGAATYEASVWQDGAQPAQVKQEHQQLGSRGKLKLRLAPNGGAAVRFIPRD